MYTKQERQEYNHRRHLQKKKALMRAIKKEVSEHQHTIFDTDQTGYGEIL